jgi:DNA polymerase III subunit delta'
MGKVVVVHPAERMNVIAANALLKTLEEPAGQTRHILSSHGVDKIPPTVRSRCLCVSVALPSEEFALAWLESKNVSQPQAMLAATGGRPVESLQWSHSGVDADLWLSLPQQISQGSAAALAEWPLAHLIEALQKLCHDCLCLAVGGSPRYFPRQSLVAAGEFSRLLDWASALREHAKHAEHPWQVGLKIEHLVEQARRAMKSSHALEDPQRPASLGRASLHSNP